MKKLFFQLSKAALRGAAGRLPLIWLIVHGGLLLALGLSALVGGPVRINTSLMDILPQSAELESAAAADAILGERNSRQIVILAGSAEFAEAKAGAEELYKALTEASFPPGTDSGFESLSLWFDETSMSRFRQYLYDYRFMLLDEETRETLEAGGGGELAANALASAYGAFTLTPLDDLEGDPFLLVDRQARRLYALQLLSGGNLSPLEDVLAARYNGEWYVMIRGSLSPGGAALASKENAVRRIYAAGSAIMAANPELRFYYSGVPFHSYESSSGARREISLISTVSVIAVLILFLFVFRSPVPVLASLAAAGVSILSALGAALLFFREVHVLSFVFGTTLIGTCVDYSIHYFVYRAGLPGPLRGAEIRSRIFRGIAMSFVSTVICFAALLFAPFAILRQFAVFSSAGLLSSFLSVMCIYPAAWSGTKNKNNSLSFPFRYALRPKKRKPLLARALLAGIPLACLVLLVINRDRVRVENRLGDLYAMPPHLAESERLNAQALNHGSSGWYFIVSGSDPETLLENEEKLRAALDRETAGGNLGSYWAVSLFIPSQKTQRRSYGAAAKLLPLADAQFGNLGFPPEAADAYRREFAAAGDRYALPGETDFPMELAASLWIGKAGEAYYSCVLPLHAADETPFRKIAGEQEHVFFVNKMKDIGAELDRLTKIMLVMFFAALVVIAAVTRFCYSWGRTLRICAVPLLLALAVLTALACLNIPLGFFAVVGLLLVFGLGLDYVFYSVEAEQKAADDPGHGLTALAITLSFATTALSFGALALSGFMPVHIFGVTVFAGLCAAYISAILVTAAGKAENQRKTGASPE
jgi:predicted exporter